MSTQTAQFSVRNHVQKELHFAESTRRHKFLFGFRHKTDLNVSGVQNHVILLSCCKEALAFDGAGGESQNVERKLALLLVNADMRSGMVCNQVAKKIECDLRIANDRESIFGDVSSGTVAAVIVDADSTPNCTELIRKMKENSARVEVLVAGTNPPISRAVEVIRSGASDYLEKPLQAGILEQALVEAFKRHGSFQAVVVPFKEVEKQAIRNAMAQAEGDKVKAARLLSMGKTTLYRKLREYGDHTRRRRRRDPHK